jgi:hypothetical protein
MAMNTIQTTLRGMILTDHLMWRTKGEEAMAMTMDRSIELLTSLPPHSVLPMNSQPITTTTSRIIGSRTILLRLLAHIIPHAIGRRKSTNDNWRKRQDRVRPSTYESLRKRTASTVRKWTRSISSTPVRHLVRVGPAADLMRQTLTRTTSDSLTRACPCKGNI